MTRRPIGLPLGMRTGGIAESEGKKLKHNNVYDGADDDDIDVVTRQ